MKSKKWGEMKTGSSRFWFKRNAFSIFFNKMGLPHRKGPGRGRLNVPCLSLLLQHPTDTSASHSTPNIEMLKHLTHFLFMNILLKPENATITRSIQEGKVKDNSEEVF
jgi:hypothetical protein